MKRPSIYWISIGLAASSALLVLITLFGVFNGPIKSVIENRLSVSLGSKVTIESLDGNPFYEFSLSRVKVTDSQRVVFACGEAVVSYRPISLLWGNLVVDSVRLVSPRLRLIEQGDAYSRIKSNIPSFDLNSIIVERGIISLNDSSVTVDNLDLELGFRHLAGEMALQVRRLKTVVLEPPLEISNLTGLALTRDDVLLVEDVQLSTNQSSIRIKGQVSELSDPYFWFEIGSDSLNLEEVGVVAGIDLPFVTAWFSARLEGSLAEYDVELDWVIGGAAGNAGLHVLGGNSSKHKLEIRGREVDLLALAGVPLRGDFQLLAEGKGLSLGGAVGSARATISDGALYGVAIDSIVSSIRYSKGQGKGVLSLDAEVGAFAGVMTLSPERLKLSGQVHSVDLKHVDGPNTVLDGKLTVRVDSASAAVQVDLDRVLIDTQDAGNLSASFERSGPAFALTSMSWVGPKRSFRVQGGGDVWRQDGGLFSLDFSGAIDPSVSFGLTGGSSKEPIRFSTRVWSEPLQFGATKESMVLSADLEGFFGLDTLKIVAFAQGGRINIEQFEGFGDETSLVVKGEMIQGSAFDLEAAYTAKDVMVIPEALRFGSSGSGLRLTAGVVGLWETPEIELTGRVDLLRLAGSVFEGLTIDSKLAPEGGGGISLQSESASWGGRTLTDFYADVGTVGGEISFLVGNQEGADNRLAIWGGASTFPESLSVRVDSAHIQFQDEFVVNRGPIALSHSASSGISVHQLHLAGPSGELEAFSIGQDGAIDIRVRKFDIGPWAFLVGLDNRIEGTLSGGLSIGGDVGDLATSTIFQIVDARIDSFLVDTIYSEVSYQGTRAIGKIGAKSGSGDLWVEGTAELGRIDPNREVDLRVVANQFPLSTVDGFWTQVTEIDGSLNGKVRLSGPADSISSSGEFSVVDGVMKVPSLNRGLTGVQFEALVAPGQVTISQFTGNGAVGTLDASGQVELMPFNLDRFKDPLFTALDVQLVANDLDVSETADIQAVINGSLDLSGTLSFPILTGELTIQKAELKLLSMLEVPPDPESIWLTVPFFENLQCELQLSAERQLWIKDEAVNVEMFGDVDVLRNLDDVAERRSGELGFRFFGTMQSLRGTYRFQNRNFRIDQDVENLVEFQGERPVNPNMRIQAVARIPAFSPSGSEGGDTRITMAISVLVSGSFTQPTILLREGTGVDLFGLAEVASSDEQALYLSYILFGRAPEDLIAAEQNLLGEQSAGLVLGMATRELQSRLADGLNLDVVQVEMGSASSISRVSVGKYINDRLFVTYEDQIGQRREFTVEYEFLPRFSLESTAVVDPDNEVAPSLRLTWSKDW